MSFNRREVPESLSPGLVGLRNHAIKSHVAILRNGFRLWFRALSRNAQGPQTPTKPVVVSQSHPKDSLGEIVYDEQDAAQAIAPVVPGVLVHPKVVKRAKPKIPMSARLHHKKFHILIEGVVTAKGDVIDVRVLDDDRESSLAKNCAKAFSADKFTPATLDGKPVAVLLQVPYTINMF